ncbi:signal transduction histidine kinase [Paucimonas lemoignei]|uniref:histidine kinase n=1 Tax=Paucimonas lemoignei TaxID=29443 RepID=A0A4R3HRP9_PAULE|nr:hybrid sensor histidine kinase/response regulator [Paucimonas lemoignei]TCS35652.1 signal transduction histidine kinase [Paucimonas lemoignei]
MPMDEINILVVDDVEQNLIATEAILAQPGIRILKASSGPEALEILLAHEIALALVDVQMPQMDGFELAELIRGSERTRAVPLIFLTAVSREAKSTFRGYEAGAVDFLHKPIDVAVLKSKVNVFVELHAKKKQLRQQLEELQQALRMNELFTAVLGHDLRTPLSTILGAADLIMLSEDPKARATAKLIKSSGKRMSKMVNQLLDVARIRSGGIQLHCKETDYVQLCRSIIAEFDASQESPRIEMTATGNVAGMADPDRLGQVLSNLIGNALQHGDGDQPVRVGIDGSQSGRIIVEVGNGGTIPAALRERIFEPYHSAQTSGKNTEGLGLGLYIVKQFVEAHGGSVELRSSEGDGTVFSVSMPRRHASCAA